MTPTPPRGPEPLTRLALWQLRHLRHAPTEPSLSSGPQACQLRPQRIFLSKVTSD